MNSTRIQAVEHACAELAAAGEPITFVTVASRSGIPRVALYRNPALRAIVEEHRAGAHDHPDRARRATGQPAARPASSCRQSPATRRTPPQARPAPITTARQPSQDIGAD
jgi:hypothetical protein